MQIKNKNKDGIICENPFLADIFNDLDFNQPDIAEYYNDNTSQNFWNEIQSINFVSINENYSKLQETLKDIKREANTYILQNQSETKSKLSKYIT